MSPFHIVLFCAFLGVIGTIFSMGVLPPRIQGFNFRQVCAGVIIAAVLSAVVGILAVLAAYATGLAWLNVLAAFISMLAIPYWMRHSVT